MKKFSVWFVAGLMMAALLFPGSIALLQDATPEATPEAAEEPDANAVEIVQAYYDKLNAGNIDEAMAFIAEDGVFINPTGSYTGYDEIRESLVGVIHDKITFVLSDFENILGRVTYAYEVHQGDALLDKGEGGLTIVHDNLVVFDGTVDTELPVSIVQVYYGLLNAGRIDEAMEFVAEDAVFINPTGSYTGQDEIRDSLIGLANDHITFELSNFVDDDGEVTYDYIVQQNDATLDKGEGGLTIVEDHLIVFDGTEDTKPTDE